MSYKRRNVFLNKVSVKNLKKALIDIDSNYAKMAADLNVTRQFINSLVTFRISISKKWIDAFSEYVGTDSWYVEDEVKA